MLFIFITPLIYQHKNNLWLVLIAPVLFIRVIFVRFDDPVALGGQSSYAFITPFIIGTLFARYNLANRWISIGLERPLIKIYKCVTEVWVIIFFYKIYRNLPSSQFWEFHFGVFPLAVIMFLIEFILPIKCIDKILVILGRHSMNIYLVHSLVQFYYPKVIYEHKHFVISVLVLLGISLTISIVIGYMKKLINYDKVIDYIQRKVLLLVT